MPKVIDQSISAISCCLLLRPLKMSTCISIRVRACVFCARAYLCCTHVRAYVRACVRGGGQGVKGTRPRSGRARFCARACWCSSVAPQLMHESLVECGVDVVFGYSGGANLPVLDQFNQSPMRFIMNRSEQCCGHAAEGYARASGKVGVILTTSGPGLTNIITPLQVRCCARAACTLATE
eukprot:5973232-Pleurochrysis_carterae.AAC.2